MARNNVLRGDRIAVSLTTNGYISWQDTSWDNNKNQQLKNLLAGQFDYVTVDATTAAALPVFRCQNSCAITVQLTARQSYGDIQYIAAEVNRLATQLAGIDYNNTTYQFVSQVQNETPATQANREPTDTQFKDKKKDDESDNTLLYIGAFAAVLLLLTIRR